MNTMQTNPQDILKTLSLSFEVFPPKKWEDFPGLYETLDELKGLHPEFISCTYGAGGSNSKKTAEIFLTHIKWFIPTKSKYTVDSSIFEIFDCG